MSAKKAAESLIANDPMIAVRVQEIEAAGHYSDGRREKVEDLLREVMGTWTLTLAADAAGVTEEQVIAAMAYHPSLRIGSMCVAQGFARRLYRCSQV